MTWQSSPMRFSFLVDSFRWLGDRFHCALIEVSRVNYMLRHKVLTVSLCRTLAIKTFVHAFVISMTEMSGCPACFEPPACRALDAIGACEKCLSNMCANTYTQVLHTARNRLVSCVHSVCGQVKKFELQLCAAT